jgi:hypothetical protein
MDRTWKTSNRGEDHGKTTLSNRVLAGLDLYGTRVDLSLSHCPQQNSTLLGRYWRHYHFIRELSSRSRALFLTDNCKLVPD